MSIQEHKKSYKISNSHRLPNDMLRIILDYAIQRKEHVLPLSLISKRWNELVKDVVKTKKRVLTVGDYLFEILTKDHTYLIELKSPFFYIFVSKEEHPLDNEVQVKVTIETNPNDYIEEEEEDINGGESLNSVSEAILSMFDSNWNTTQTIGDLSIPHFESINATTLWSTISRLKIIINRLILAANPPNFVKVATMSIRINIYQDITTTHWMAIDKWPKKHKNIYSRPNSFYYEIDISKLEEMLKDSEIQQLLYWNSE